jgi:hypothetical protein
LSPGNTCFLDVGGSAYSDTRNPFPACAPLRASGQVGLDEDGVCPRIPTGRQHQHSDGVHNGRDVPYRVDFCGNHLTPSTTLSRYRPLDAHLFCNTAAVSPSVAAKSYAMNLLYPLSLFFLLTEAKIMAPSGGAILVDMFAAGRADNSEDVKAGGRPESYKSNPQHRPCM